MNLVILIALCLAPAVQTASGGAFGGRLFGGDGVKHNDQRAMEVQYLEEFARSERSIIDMLESDPDLQKKAYTKLLESGTSVETVDQLSDAIVESGYGTPVDFRKAMGDGNPFIRTDRKGEAPREMGLGGQVDTDEHLYVLIGTMCGAVMVTLLFLYQLVMHLTNFKWPSIQKFYVRMIFMASVYAWFSWFTIYNTEYHALYDLVKNCYEAYVIYAFWNMLMTYVGGYEYIVEKLEEERHVGQVETQLKFNFCPGECCQLFEFSSHRKQFCTCWAMVYQFIFVRPAMGVLSVFYERQHNIIAGDKYIRSITLISVFLAMMGLLNVYLTLGERLTGLSAEFKFAIIKLTVFLIVWQELVLHLLVENGTIPSYYCEAVGQCSPDMKCWDECNPDVPASAIRTIALAVSVEMILLSLCDLNAFRHNDICLDTHPLLEEQEKGKEIHETDNPESRPIIQRMSFCYKLFFVFNIFDNSTGLLEWNSNFAMRCDPQPRKYEDREGKYSRGVSPLEGQAKKAKKGSELEEEPQAAERQPINQEQRSYQP